MARNTRATGSNNFEWTIGDSTAAAYVDSPILKEFYSTGRTQNGNNITFAELINIGSTSRGTNCSETDDFDFVMRVDRNIINDNYKLESLRDLIINSLGGSGLIMDENIRNYNTNLLIDNINYPVKIDISFTEKTDKLDYSTDSCLNDRLSNIKNIDENKYELVLNNIVFAKEFMKNVGAYKPSRISDEGGMGGVGIENWILQNGGSFIDAATSFLSVANIVDSFEAFKLKYHVYDFGNNFLSKDNFSHDDFIDNMSESGFELMKNELNKYYYTANDKTRF